MAIYEGGLFDLRGVKLFKAGKCPLSPSLKETLPIRGWTQFSGVSGVIII